MDFSICTHSLSNGLTVLYCHTPLLRSFEISIHINTGSRDENADIAGVSHFLEHMMFRGCKAYPNSYLLARALEEFGGETNAMTSIEATNYWLRGDAEKTVHAIERFAQFFLYPNYADLSLERQVILQEMLSDMNEESLSVDPETLSMATLFDEHPLGTPILGTEESVNAIDTARLEQKRQCFYTPQNCILTIHTALDLPRIVPSLEAHFAQDWASSLQRPPVRASASSYAERLSPGRKPRTALCLQNNPDNQFVLKLVLPTQGNITQNVIHLTFLQRILDDGICTRLPACIRERFGLVYDISCDTQFYQDVGTFSIDATVSEDFLTDLLDKLGLELRRLLDEKPSQDEVDHIRYRYLFDLKSMYENPARLLQRRVNEHFMGTFFSIEEEIACVEAVTPDLVFETAKDLFSAARRAFILVGPRARRRRNIVEQFLSCLDGA